MSEEHPPQLDVTAGNQPPYIMRKTSNNLIDKFSTFFMCGSMLFLMLDPIFSWFAFFVAFSFFINKKTTAFSFLSILPTIYICIVSLKYTMMMNHKPTPYFKEVFPPLFAR